MIQLLFAMLSGEGFLIVVLLVKSPLRKLAIMGLDRVKRGRGPVMVKTIAATIFVVLVSSFYSIGKIQKRYLDASATSPTDQVLMAGHLLEASLMGYCLFLGLVIDRLHHYMRELRVLRKSMEALKKQNRGLEDGKSSNSDELKVMEEEVAGLKMKVKSLESIVLEREKEAKTAEANALALKKQSEDLLIEYDRLQEDNQNLRNQLQSIEWRLSHSDIRKNT